MSNDEKLVKIRASHASAACESYEIADAAKVLLLPDMPPHRFLQTLIDHELYSDAVHFLANALPHREAVWWACLCVGETLDESAPVEHTTALDAARAWVYEPRQKNCHAAMAAAEAAGFDTASGWAGVAAFWSGKTLAPADAPVVPPAPGLVAKAVAGAVILAAVSGPAEKADDAFRTFLEWGTRIAKGVPAK